MKQEYKREKTSILKLRRVFSFIVAIVILFVLVIPAYADSINNQSFSDTNQPVPVGNSLSQALPYVKTNWCDSYFAVTQPDIYTFGEGRSIYFASKIQSDWSVYWWNINFGESSPYDSGVFKDTIVFDSVNQLYYMEHGAFAAYEDGFYVPQYSTVAEGLEAIADYIENGGGNPTPSPSPTPVTTTLNYSLPAGNVAYIQFNSEFDSFTLKSVMPVSSYVIGGSPWPQSNQYYGFASQVPSGSFTPPTTKINWEKNGNTTLVGITKNAIFEYGPHHPTSGNYLVVYNPAYYGGTDNGPYEFLNNGSITITAENVVSITVLQLESLLSPGENGVIDVETTPTGVVYEADIDNETGEVIWENDNPPTTGGGNLPVSSESGFKSFLSTLVQKIVDVFEPAHDAIQTIASAISNFAQWMRALYIWLPAPVLNLLTAAISLAIIIGVVKVFI